MKLLIGCPVRNRAWILPEWFRHIKRSCEMATIEPEFAFLVGSSKDETFDIIEAEGDHARITADYICEGEPHAEHMWDIELHKHMADIRTVLLKRVRLLQPDYFLSIDSDILAHPLLVSDLLETAAKHPEWSAVGGKAYMGRGRHLPSYGLITAHGWRRPDSDGVHPADILMAIKLMRPQAYALDYTGHPDGEDIGWSMACRGAGLKLGFDGRVCSKHVMKPEQKDKVDERCGY